MRTITARLSSDLIDTHAMCIPPPLLTRLMRLCTVVVWDNRSMLHSTEAYDYDNVSRHMHLCSMKGPPEQGSPGPGQIPLRVGPVVAGMPEIRKLWWGEDDPRQFVLGSQGEVKTFSNQEDSGHSS